jgi:hypothetical protein
VLERPAVEDAQSCRRQLGDETPERAQLVDAPLRRVTGDDRALIAPIEMTAVQSGSRSASANDS